MKKRFLLMLAGAAAIGAYSYAEGKGPFNKVKFKDQHDAVSRYVEAHYPGALYSPICETGNGWTTVIRRIGFEPVVLYITRSGDGMFIFREESAVFPSENNPETQM